MESRASSATPPTPALTESRVALATEEQMCASFWQQQQSLEQRIRELTQLVEQRRGEIRSFVHRKSRPSPRSQESRQSN